MSNENKDWPINYVYSNFINPIEIKNICEYVRYQKAWRKIQKKEDRGKREEKKKWSKKERDKYLKSINYLYIMF